MSECTDDVMRACLCVYKLVPDTTMGWAISRWCPVTLLLIHVMLDSWKAGPGWGLFGSGSWERNREPFAHCHASHAPQRGAAGWLHGDAGEQAWTTKPGQLNLTFIMGKGISLYVADMAGRKEADLNPHTPRVGSYLLLLSRSVMSDSATP